MNASTKITMSNAKVQLPITNAEIARRLEMFEIALRENTIVDLQRQIASDREQVFTALALANDDVILFKSEPTEDLIEAFKHEVNRKQLTGVVAIFGADVSVLNDDEKDHLRSQLASDLVAEIDELNKHKSNTAKIIEHIQSTCDSWKSTAVEVLFKYKNQCAHSEKLSKDLYTANQEIKRLNALEPDRSKSRIKRLLDDKTALKEAVDDLRRNNKKLTVVNRQLDIALDKAKADINTGTGVEPLKVIRDAKLGTFEIYGTESIGHYTVMDMQNLTNQQVEAFTNGSVNVPRPRPVPKVIQTAVAQIHAELAETAGGAA